MYAYVYYDIYTTLKIKDMKERLIIITGSLLAVAGLIGLLWNCGVYFSAVDRQLVEYGAGIGLAVAFLGSVMVFLGSAMRRKSL